MKKWPWTWSGDRFPSLLNPGILIIHAVGVFPGSKAIAGALQSNPPSLVHAIFILASLAGCPCPSVYMLRWAVRLTVTPLSVLSSAPFLMLLAAAKILVVRVRTLRLDEEVALDLVGGSISVAVEPGNVDYTR